MPVAIAEAQPQLGWGGGRGERAARLGWGAAASRSRRHSELGDRDRGPTKLRVWRGSAWAAGCRGWPPGLRWQVGWPAN